MKQKKFWIFRKPGCQGSNAFKNDTREKKRSILLGILMIKKGNENKMKTKSKWKNKWKKKCKWNEQPKPKGEQNEKKMKNTMKIKWKERHFRKLAFSLVNFHFIFILFSLFFHFSSKIRKN